MADAMPGWQKLAHHGTHGLLYTLFFAVPLIGWAYSSAAGFPIVFLGLWQLPDFVPVSKELAEAIKPWHQITAFAMAGLVLLHVAAALKHHLIDRDGLLARMRPCFCMNLSSPLSRIVLGAALVASAPVLVGQRLHDVLPAEQAERFMQLSRDTLQSGQTHSVEYEMQTLAGLRQFEGRT
eukprot:gene35630-58616_t